MLRHWSSVAAVAVFAVGRWLAASEVYVFHHEEVLGTRCELRFVADDATAAAGAEQRVLQEIERLRSVLSTYDEQSELSRWQSGVDSGDISNDLAEVLRISESWQAKTNSAFHPGAELLTRHWSGCAADNRLPEAAQLRPLVARLQTAGWRWDAERRQAAWAGAYPVAFNALAKGYIIDRATDTGLQAEGVSGVMVNIGGDLRVAGDLQQRIEVAGATSGSIAAALELSQRAVATSSGSFRGFTIQGRNWSHILDPRTGWPVDRVVSATIVAPCAVDADALATACSVMTPDESLRLIESLPETECQLIEADGRSTHSSGWDRISAPGPLELVWAETPAKKQSPPWNGGFELTVDLEINNPAGARGYRRPYVSVWLEDKDGYPVRTLALWVQTTGPGPRWIPDLKRWYRSDLQRKIVEQTDLVATVSEGTRRPGQYTLTWDGADNEGELVKPGDYTLCVEAAREHGTYQLTRKKLTIEQQPFTAKLDGNLEIKAVSVDYHRTESAPPAGR